MLRYTRRLFNTASNMSYVKGGPHQLLKLHTSQLLRQTAAKYPKNMALICHHEKNLRWTYEEMNERVDHVAASLIEMGLQKGDRVGIYSPNYSQWTLLQFACARANLILVNINPAFQASELKYSLQKVGVKLLVTAESFKTSNYIDIINRAIPELCGQRGLKIESKEYPDLDHIVNLGDDSHNGMLRWNDMLKLADNIQLDKMHEREGEIKYTDDTNIQYTSGTTGYPKGVTLTHYNVVNNGLYTGLRQGISSDDIICIPVPLYHCFGCVLGNLVAINYGATMVYPSEGFDPKATIKAVGSEKCTALYGVPTMFIAMLDELAKVKNDIDVSSLRTGIIAGSLCPKPLMERIIAEMNLNGMTNCYGQTETGPVSFQSDLDTSFDKKVSAVGKVHPNVEAKIIDEEGNILPKGQQGELCVKGYLVMSKYWNDPEITEDTVDKDGWCHSGDLAFIDEDDYVSITGRVKDMIIRGGENIYPKEIEEFFLKHEDIKDIQVIGVEDDLMGQEVCAWISTYKEISVDDLREYAKGEIAHFKIPKYVKFVDSYPLTVTGKIKKNVMREQSDEILRNPDQNEIFVMGFKKI